MNGLKYQIIKRNDQVAMYGISKLNTDQILYVEISKIYIRKEKEYQGRKYKHREALPSNSVFGIDHSRCLNYENIDIANEYFEWFTKYLQANMNERKKIKSFVSKNGRYKL